MSKLRAHGTRAGTGEAIPDDTAIFLILSSVNKRRSLIHGRLHDGNGGHCAIGAFWEDNPNATLHSALIDEVAAVNDSVQPGPPGTAKQRWKTVVSWLRWKKRVLANTTVVARVDK